jgi:hypothetical protein
MEMTVAVWALIIAAIFVLVTVLLPPVLVQRFNISVPEKRAEVEDSYRKTVAQILGAAAIAVTWSWTWVKDHDTIKQNHDTMEQTRIQAANQQYSEMLKLLSSDNVDARVAGIYPMEALVAARSEYYTPVVNTLKSTIRRHEPKPPPQGAEKSKVSDDVIAAIYVLGRLPRQEAAINMQHLYLVGGDFLGQTGFRGSDFSGAALFATNFSGADLTGAVFDGAQMSDWESVGSARWSDQLARDWTGAKGWERVQYVVKFDYANLTNASFKGTSVSGASFQHADLSGTKFQETDLSRADFQNAVNLDKAVFTGSCYGTPGQPLGLSQAIVKMLTSPCPKRSPDIGESRKGRRGR